MCSSDSVLLLRAKSCATSAGTLKVTSPSASALGVRVAIYSASPSVPDVRLTVVGPVSSMSSI